MSDPERHGAVEARRESDDSAFAEPTPLPVDP